MDRDNLDESAKPVDDEAEEVRKAKNRWAASRYRSKQKGEIKMLKELFAQQSDEIEWLKAQVKISNEKIGEIGRLLDIAINFCKSPGELKHQMNIFSDQPLANTTSYISNHSNGINRSANPSPWPGSTTQPMSSNSLFPSPIELRVRAGSRDTSVSADAAVIPVGIGECYNLECACELLEESHNPRMENGQCMTNKGPLGQAVRKELRTLTASERKTLFDALLLLHESGEFHQHVRAHGHADKSAGAHGGPAFLPWHREYLKRVELALRQFDTSIGIPYIDWTLDDALENPRDSILFSEYLMGDTSGKRDNENGSWVINGPFKDFATAHGNPRLTRWVGVPFEDPITKEMIKPRPMTQEHVDYQLNAENVDQIITFPIFKNEKGCKYSDQIKNAGEMDPENAHGRGHMFVGGDMNEFSTASNDPIFYMHHAFVDFLWEEWRKNKQDSSQWETEWITDSEACSAPQHFREANMYPFIPMVNRDGLSVNYTKNMYKYEPRPTCNPDLGIDCKSEFLFCDLTKGKKGPRCASKIKKGKSCSGYEHKEDVCYLGECVDGKCVENDPNRPKTTPSPKPKTIKKMTKQETCWNENKCCAFWAARGDCKYNKAYMDQHCKASCGICKPGYKLVDDCTDRSPHCKNWKAQGYCEQYKDSMDENCRRSCNRCENTRAQECSAEGFSATTKAPFRCHDTLRNKCYNEHPCCQYWSQLGECQRNIVWMSCHCKVSCGVCYPDDYYYNSEIDYHAACPSLARKGECPRRLWMTENCRSSCGSSYNPFQLSQMCSAESGPNAKFDIPEHDFKDVSENAELFANIFG